ncbi:MAG TPA: efflux transporter outer membrane subunit [Candidatus Methylomirabilis sp.]|nr:efflux transporter outer membrane subunit [Candidatus Methylomirabilis sp.]
MRVAIAVWIVVGAGVLAGCAIGPDYARPPVTEVGTFRGQATAERASVADLPWWEAFGDPVLKTLIQEALANNYDVKIAAARVEEARAQLGVARSQFFPQIGYNFAVARSRNPLAAVGVPIAQLEATTNFFAGALSSSWELDIWGRIRRANEAARANLLATDDARRGVWLTLVSDVAQAYFELAALDVALGIARDSVEAFQGTYDLFQDRLRFGLASRVQTARAEGALGGALATIPELKKQIVAKENQISILLGKAPGPIARGAPMYAQLVTLAVPAGLPSTLLERRPDLRQAEEQLVRANALVGVAKAEFLPKLNLTGVLGTASPEITAVTHGGSLVWAVAAGLAGPIFQGGRILQNYRATRAEREQAVLQYQQAVITALREVADSLTALAELREAEAGQQRSVNGLQDAVALATDRYRFGLASYYEVLEAQQQLYPAEQTLAQIRRDRLTSYVQLYKALGGGWNLSDAEWTGPTEAMSGAGQR